MASHDRVGWWMLLKYTWYFFSLPSKFYAPVEYNPYQDILKADILRETSERLWGITPTPNENKNVGQANND